MLPRAARPLPTKLPPTYTVSLVTATARERGDQLAGGRVVRRDPVAGLAVGGGEVARDVDARAVRRGRDGHHLAVQLGGERLDQLAGRDVVGEQVRARDEVRPG